MSADIGEGHNSAGRALEVAGTLKESDRVADPHLFQYAGIEAAAVIGTDFGVPPAAEERVRVLLAMHYVADVNAEVLNPGHVNDGAQPGEPLLAGPLRLLPDPVHLPGRGELLPRPDQLAHAAEHQLPARPGAAGIPLVGR